jgi:hypothetical protein
MPAMTIAGGTMPRAEHQANRPSGTPIAPGSRVEMCPPAQGTNREPMMNAGCPTGKRRMAAGARESHAETSKSRFARRPIWNSMNTVRYQPSQ